MANLEDLERRVDNDPASIAFAQLAEEYRRAGRYGDAVRVARAGLTRHPGYLSARVTLGRVLVELDELDAAKRELETVLKSAPENLAAIRALAEIHQRRGDSPEPAPAPTRTATLDAPRPTPPPPDPIPGPVPEVAPPEVLPPILDVFPDAPPPEPSHAVDLELQEFNTALEALDALTFDLPETDAVPSPAAHDFDLGGFRFDDQPAVAPPDEWNLEPAATPQEAANPVPEEPPDPVVEEPAARLIEEPGDPVLQELESWLGALVSDRSERRRR